MPITPCSNELLLTSPISPCPTPNTITRSSFHPSDLQGRSLTPPRYIGCYTDNTAGRVFSHDLTNSIPGGYTNMTIANCARAANSSGYLYFGIEYSQECWADMRIATSSMLRSNASCNMPCKGNSSEFCGSGDLLQTYQLTSNITSIVYFKEAQPTTTTAAAP